jgi:hypothetical protein
VHTPRVRLPENHDFGYDGNPRPRTMPDPPGEEESADSDAQPRDPGVRTMMTSTLDAAVAVSAVCEAYAADTGLLVRRHGEHRRVGGSLVAERPGSELACSSLEVKKGGVVKTRIARWAARWRERRLVRKQTRQTSAARQAKRAAEAGRSHPMGQGGSGGG